VYRDFIYLDINRVQSIIAQLQQGLLNEVLEGKTEQTTGKMQMAMNLLAMMLPVSASGSIEHSKGTSLNESRVLHDYAFETARRSLEDEGLLLEDDSLDRDSVPDTGFVLVRGSARISDYRTLEKIAANFDKVDKVFASKKKEPGIGKTMKEMTTVIDTFFKDAIRVKITNTRDCEFIGPLARDHLREDIRDLIYKYSSAPEGEWVMLADVSRVPRPEDSEEEAIMERLEEAEGGNSVSSQMGRAMPMLNAFQELFGSVSYPEVAVSPVAVYREVSS
jgi:hypothetical protein